LVRGSLDRATSLQVRLRSVAILIHDQGLIKASRFTQWVTIAARVKAVGIAVVINSNAPVTSTGMRCTVMSDYTDSGGRDWSVFSPEVSWVKRAFESALLVVDNGELVKAAGMHVQPDYEGSPRKIHPSNLAQDCQLAQVKQFRGHGPQPHVDWSSSRNGKPNANSNITFARGFLGEGLVVAAFKRYAELTQEFEILGCAPELVFETDQDEAHPDLMVLRNGEIELIQIKTPSVFAFERYDKGEDSMVMQRYRPQMVGEMYIGRKMGIEIVRSYLLMFTWEGGRPGTESGDKVRSIVIPLEWEEAMTGYVENLANEILEADRQATLGKWPKPANREDEFNKWPCSYCKYARTRKHEGQVICTENAKWETPESESDRLKGLSSAATTPPVPSSGSS